MVPLTQSMFVPGVLEDVERVVIDIGTGYFVEKTITDARDFLKRKVYMILFFDVHLLDYPLNLVMFYIRLNSLAETPKGWKR
jgi:hypothetical protein